MDLDRWTDERLLREDSAELCGLAFERFYIRHERLMAAYFMRRVRNPELASELTAETFARALSSRRRFRDEGPTSAVRWLYGIAFRVLSMSARDAEQRQRAVHELRLWLRAPDEERLEAFREAGEIEQVMASLERLGPGEREAVRAFVLEERSYEDLAQQTGAAIPTLRKRVSRGIASLRRELKENS